MDNEQRVPVAPPVKSDLELIGDMLKSMGRGCSRLVVHLYRRKWWLAIAIVLSMLGSLLATIYDGYEYKMTISAKYSHLLPAEIETLIYSVDQAEISAADSIAKHIKRVAYERIRDTTLYGSQKEALNYGIIVLSARDKGISPSAYTEYILKRIKAIPFAKQRMSDYKRKLTIEIRNMDSLIMFASKQMATSLQPSSQPVAQTGGLPSGGKSNFLGHIEEIMEKKNQAEISLGYEVAPFEIITPFTKPKTGTKMRMAKRFFLFFSLLAALMLIVEILLYGRRKAQAEQTAQST